ncbi:MAG: DUF1828 domain-containing protein [Sulfuriferula sp.]
MPLIGGKNMNCVDVANALGFDCLPMGAGHCVYTPFSYGDDGEVVRLFVADLPGNRVRIYDGGDAIMHAETHNVQISEARIDKIKAFCREGVELDRLGQIAASCSITDLPMVMPRVLDAVLAVSHLETLWEHQYD